MSSSPSPSPPTGCLPPMGVAREQGGLTDMLSLESHSEPGPQVSVSHEAVTQVASVLGPFTWWPVGYSHKRRHWRGSGEPSVSSHRPEKWEVGPRGEAPACWGSR